MLGLLKHYSRTCVCCICFKCYTVHTFVHRTILVSIVNTQRRNYNIALKIPFIIFKSLKITGHMEVRITIGPKCSWLDVRVCKLYHVRCQPLKRASLD